MSAHQSFPDQRGTAKVGVLSAMEPWETELILNLRLWCSGPDGQTKVWNCLAAALPRGAAHDEMHAFERLIDILARYAHRPLMHHDVACACVGADEALFAHLVGLASGGDLHEASQVACLLVTAAQAEPVALLAAQVGATAKTLAGRHRHGPGHRHPDNVVRLH